MPKRTGQATGLSALVIWPTGRHNRTVNVLVAYATAHGSTKQVAEAIAERMRAANLVADVRAADDVADPSSYAAVILGSAVHNGRWLTPASTLLSELREHATRPLWVFSVCTVGETTSFLGPRVSRLARRRRKLPIDLTESEVPHRFFAGVIEKTHWNVAGRVFFVVTGGRYGDHRDWSDINRWADMIAADLTGEARAVDQDLRRGTATSTTPATSTSTTTTQPPKLPPPWFIHNFWRAHRALHRVSRGRFLWSTSSKRGWGALHLTTIGRRSGKERGVIIGYIEDGPNLVALAMNGWDEGHPSWWLNLQAHPDAVVQLPHQDPHRVRGRPAEGEERDQLWKRWAEIDVGLDAYASQRSVETPVVVLEPRDGLA